MAEFLREPWNTSNAVPHFIPLKSAEYLTDPAVIKAYDQLRDEPNRIRFMRRVCRNLHFGIWIRSVAWCTSLVFALWITFIMIIELDFHVKSLVYPQTMVIAEEDAEDASTTMAIQAESEELAEKERVVENEGPVIR